MRAHKNSMYNSATTKKRYRDTAIRRYSDTEPEPGTGTAQSLCKLSHFITAGDLSDNIFQGGENHFRGIC